MNLDQLLKLENVTNYQLWWYGNSIAKYYIGEDSLKKEYVSFSLKGTQPDMKNIFIVLYGLGGYKCKYMYAIKLTEKIEEEMEPGQISYRWERVPLKLDEYSGRLVLRTNIKFAFLNNSGKTFDIDEIYPPKLNRKVPYFLSYDEVELSFGELKEMITNKYEDYYKHLSCVKGIYMIIDGNTGKQYIGSAYGKEALYGRWKSYAETYHGGNEELVDLYNQHGPEYFEKFKYIILQILPLKISDKEITTIETKYKNKYLTKVYGLNKN